MANWREALPLGCADATEQQKAWAEIKRLRQANKHWRQRVTSLKADLQAMIESDEEAEEAEEEPESDDG